MVRALEVQKNMPLQRKFEEAKEEVAMLLVLSAAACLVFILLKKGVEELLTLASAHLLGTAAVEVVILGIIYLFERTSGDRIVRSVIALMIAGSVATLSILQTSEDPNSPVAKLLLMTAALVAATYILNWRDAWSLKRYSEQKNTPLSERLHLEVPAEWTDPAADIDELPFPELFSQTKHEELQEVIKQTKEAAASANRYERLIGQAELWALVWGILLASCASAFVYYWKPDSGYRFIVAFVSTAYCLCAVVACVIAAGRYSKRREKERLAFSRLKYRGEQVARLCEVRIEMFDILSVIVRMIKYKDFSSAQEMLILLADRYGWGDLYPFLVLLLKEENDAREEALKVMCERIPVFEDGDTEHSRSNTTPHNVAPLVLLE